MNAPFYYLGALWGQDARLCELRDKSSNLNHWTKAPETVPNSLPPYRSLFMFIVLKNPSSRSGKSINNPN